MTAEQVVKKLKQMVRERGSLRGLARELGVSASYLCDVLGGQRRPGPKILTPLGLVAVRKIRVKYIDRKLP